MRLTIKTLAQAQHAVELEPSATVGDLRAAVFAASAVPIDRQRLIHAGRVLADDAAVLAETPIRDGDAIVLMALKRPAEPVASAALAATAAAAAEKENPVPPAGSIAAGDMAIGEEYDAAVQRLVDMGFERSRVVGAMRASFNNAERAVEYLTAGARGAAEDSPIAGLRDDPHFAQLRALVAENPQMLAPVLEQLAQSHPGLVQQIQRNPEAFQRILLEGMHDSDFEDASSDGGDSGDEGDLGAGYVTVSPEEQAAIERLGALGFDRSRVLEAFLACDRDEQLAANYLLEHMGDD